MLILLGAMVLSSVLAASWGGNPEALRTWVRAEEQGGRNERGDVTRGAAPVAWHCTRCVVLHPLRGAAPEQNGCNAYGSGAMPTDRVYRAHRQERVWNLESHNAKESGISSPIHNPGLGRRIKGATSRGALHPLRGSVPVAWLCTRYGALHPLRGAAPEQNGCNAYGSGAMPTDRVYRAHRQERVWNLESHNAKESGISSPIHNPGLGRRIKGATSRGALHLLRGAAPDQNGCNAYRSGAMPTDRVYRAPRQERVRNLESRNAKESGLSAPYINPGTWQANQGAT